MTDIDRRDGRFWLLIAALILVGGLSISVAVWVALQPWSDNAPIGVVAGIGGGIIGGVLLIGFSVTEVARRLRKGPQMSGRHSG